jgi:hypothetical protein
MYRSCIFCSAELKANDALERFPVGRSIAFDAAKGRLWAVCPRCARWNLAPIEERWEAIEDAERLFRDTRTRVQSENVGLAMLRDGTRLVRVGQALPGELAAWRYGREMRRRFLRGRVEGVVRGVASMGPLLGSLLGPVGTMLYAPILIDGVQRRRRANHVAHVVDAADSPSGRPLPLRWRDVAAVRTVPGPEESLGLELFRWQGMPLGATPVVLTGRAATAVMGKAMVRINRAGADAPRVQGAVDSIARAGGAEMLLSRTAVGGYGLAAPDVELGDLFPTFRAVGRFVTLRGRPETAPPLPEIRPLSGNPHLSLAVEMALHEETERRALMGELAALEEMWRQAEEIAAIADRLPDGIPASRPPGIELSR